VPAFHFARGFLEYAVSGTPVGPLEEEIMKRSAFSHGFAALAAASCVLLAFGQTLGASDSDASLPPIIKSGFDACASGGPESAINAWLKGAPNEVGRFANSQSENLQRAERYFGQFESYELLATKDVGERSKLMYFALNFKRGALYFRFQLYKTNDGWIVQHLSHHLTPDEAMPWLAQTAGR
jgi:hypothetical protein